MTELSLVGGTGIMLFRIHLVIWASLDVGLHGCGLEHYEDAASEVV